jgi:hypothetical protein
MCFLDMSTGVCEQKRTMTGVQAIDPQMMKLSDVPAT